MSDGGGRRPWLVIVLVVAALLLAGGVVAALTMGGGDDSSSSDRTEETDDRDTEPEDTEAEDTEPADTEVEVTEPEVTEPEVTEPEVTEPEVTEPPTTVAQPVGVGGTIELTVDDSRVQVIVESILDPAPADEILGPDPGNKLVAIGIRLVNVGDERYQGTPSNGAQVIDAASQQFNARVFPTTGGPDLGTVTILPGDTRAGFITFEVPDAGPLSRFQLTLDPFLSEDFGTWDLTLPPSPPPAAPPVLLPAEPFGTPVRLEGSSAAIEVTVLQLLQPAPTDGFFTPTPGNDFVAVQIRITNVGDTVYEESPGTGIELVNQLGQGSTEGFTDTAAGPGFGGIVRLPPGDSRVGFVTFEAPVGVPLVKMQMALDFGFAEDVGEFRLTPG